jgi:ribosomal-protein-alanine N-acetyltransferase
MLDIAFSHLGLHSISAWTVVTNLASARILEKNGFTRIGVRRQCHRIDGRFYDRLLFDLLREDPRNGVPLN